MTHLYLFFPLTPYVLCTYSLAKSLTLWGQLASVAISSLLSTSLLYCSCHATIDGIFSLTISLTYPWIWKYYFHLLQISYQACGMKGKAYCVLLRFYTADWGRAKSLEINWVWRTRMSKDWPRKTILIPVFCGPYCYKRGIVLISRLTKLQPQLKQLYWSLLLHRNFTAWWNKDCWVVWGYEYHHVWIS